MDFVRSVIDAISTCCLNCREDDLRAGEPTERTSLLQPNQSDSRNLQIRRLSEPEINDFPNSLPNEKDEQSALNRIVQETSTNIIDVAALDTHHILEQSEYNDRVKLYSQRLAQQWNTIPTIETNYNGLLKDVPNPETLLSWTLPIEDIISAKEFVKETAQALNEMKIDNHEDLVVPFQVT